MKQFSASLQLPTTWQRQSQVRPSLASATIAPALDLDTAVPRPPEHHEQHVWQIITNQQQERNVLAQIHTSPARKHTQAM